MKDQKESILINYPYAAKDKIDVSLISQPSDLFGRELLPECTFESQYGKLKFNAIVIPDFSKDEIELEMWTEHLDKIKAFLREEDLLKKNEIIDSIFTHIPHVTFGKMTVGLNLKKSYLFMNILLASIQFRLF